MDTKRILGSLLQFKFKGKMIHPDTGRHQEERKMLTRD
jgi:hypothetical protein